MDQKTLTAQGVANIFGVPVDVVASPEVSTYHTNKQMRAWLIAAASKASATPDEAATRARGGPGIQRVANSRMDEMEATGIEGKEKENLVALLLQRFQAKTLEAYCRKG